MERAWCCTAFFALINMDELAVVMEDPDDLHAGAAVIVFRNGFRIDCCWPAGSQREEFLERMLELMSGEQGGEEHAR